jgi:hypothetical protein
VFHQIELILDLHCQSPSFHQWCHTKETTIEQLIRSHVQRPVVVMFELKDSDVFMKGVVLLIFMSERLLCFNV